LAAIAVSSLGMVLVPSAFAGAASLTVTTPVSSSSTVEPSGGTITVSVTSSVTATCTAKAFNRDNPNVPSDTVTCAAGAKVMIPLLLPGNTTTAVQSYKVSVTACAKGVCVTSSAITVTQWAYKLTISATAAPWGTPKSVSCPSASFCMVADSSSYVYTRSGTTYKRVVLQQGRLIDAVACVSTTQCIAGDINGDGFTYDGTKWRVDDGLLTDSNAVTLIGAISPGRKDMLQWVNSTASGSTTHSNVAELFNGTSFLPAIHYNTPGVVTGVSCPLSTTQCYAVDNKGFLTTFGGSTGTTSASMSSSGTPLTSISCSSSSSCVVGGNGGFARTFRPGRPTYGNINLSTKSNIIGVSCPTDTMCFLNSSAAVTIAGGDLNGDGYPDLVATSSTKNPTTGAIIVVCVPGSTAVAMMVGNHKDMTGHITLIR